MKKQHYIAPVVELYKIQASCLLPASAVEEVELPWSGDSPGTAGPDEIDDFSTIDTF